MGLLAANSSVPAGAFRKKPACDEAEATGHVAGTLYVAPDGHVLMLHRSGAEENFAHHWALPGGGVDAGETPAQGAAREAREEIGYDGPEPTKLLDKTRTATGKVFHTFVQPVAEKFTPKLNAEHSGFTWAPIDKLPAPLHPAVQATLDGRIGKAADMAPEEWQGLRDGFLKWTAEEEAEPEHAADELRLAMDDASMRTTDEFGRMHVKRTNISKATVSPYRGAEVPGWKELGLDPDNVYQFLRDPEELRKAAPTFNGVQLLRKHVAVNADDHKPYDVVGSLGNEGGFEEPYLRNGLVIWSADDIKDVEDEKKCELSACYKWRPDMTSGTFDGMPYDGVMRDIVGNHVALVKDGRAGPDVLVADSMENLRMSKSTRLGAVTLHILAASVAPLLAMDQKLNLTTAPFAALTRKNFKASKDSVLAEVRKGLEGKVRKGVAMDASMAEVGKVMDTVGELFGGEKDEGADESTTEAQHGAMEAAAHGESKLGIPQSVGQEYVSQDAEPLKNFLKEKGMGDEDIKKACDLMPKGMAGAADESEEDKKKREDEEKAKAAKDEKDEKEKKAMDEKMKNMVDKPAMDAAITAAVTTARKTEQGIRAAIDAVRPYIGDVPASLAFDSADDVYRHAAVHLGVDGAKDIHPSALPALIKLQPKAGAQPIPRPMAMDAAATKDFNERFPAAGRIRQSA